MTSLTMVLAAEGGELRAHLAYHADVVLAVSSLRTGASRDMHGQVRQALTCVCAVAFPIER
jgi:hypothetical protein